MVLGIEDPGGDTGIESGCLARQRRVWMVWFVGVMEREEGHLGVPGIVIM